ncbi:hypothetical protein A4X09_0g1097 [Tilletia walkeri]|uniref:Uncharacterized protein n=1 Tax=Tilletia walkeri TaxID=117179 RepID=A0A8X7NF39_9BASI|nr:hypothetical protein A4X09_0g1097 [Tilletia walkeri]
MHKGKAKIQGDGPVLELLDQERKSAAQEKWLKEALQVIASPTSAIKARLAALAKIEQHMAKTVLSGNPQKAATWWKLQQNQDCNVATVLLPHLHVLHLHLALVGASAAPSSSSRRSGDDDGLKLAVSSLSEVDLIAEEIVISLSLLQGLVVCDRDSRSACVKRVSLENILLVLGAPHLVEKDLTAPACHALDLLMCILVDSDEDVSDLFESLSGVDQISTIWKARAENVAMRRAAARVEREAARLRGPDFLQHRRNRSGPSRTASDGPSVASPGKQARRGYSEDFDGYRPSTPRANNGGLSPISSPPRAAKRASAPPVAPASPAGPRIPQRSSSTVDSPAAEGPGSPEGIYRGPSDVFNASRQSLGLVRSSSPSEENQGSRPKPVSSGSRDASDGEARARPNSRRATRASDEPAKDDDQRDADEDESDELCEKCIEFLIFYLQPELLEREAERERRLKAKMTNGTVLQLGAARKGRAGEEKSAPPVKSKKREQAKAAPQPVLTKSKTSRSAEQGAARDPAKQRSNRA